MVCLKVELYVYKVVPLALLSALSPSMLSFYIEIGMTRDECGVSVLTLATTQGTG